MRVGRIGGAPALGPWCAGGGGGHTSSRTSGERRIRGDGLFVREKDKAEKARGSLIRSNEEISGKMKWKRWERHCSVMILVP